MGRCDLFAVLAVLLRPAEQLRDQAVDQLLKLWPTHQADEPAQTAAGRYAGGGTRRASAG